MNSWLPALARALGDCPVIDDRDVIDAHSRDQAPLAPVGAASALVRARGVDDVLNTLRFAHANRVPVVPRGGGSGLAGGANALDGCILLSVTGMNRILEIDPAARLAVVEPGVLNGDLARAAAQHDLWYAPDPSSRDISTIGGNIATNAGGGCCLKYGVTGDHVSALAVALPTGELIRTGSRTRKNVAGLDLTRLLIGSEGTLGVVVEATVRLVAAPRPPSTLLAALPSLDAAGEVIVSLAGRLDLSLLEMMDRATVQAVEAMAPMGLDTGAAALLLVQSDAPNAPAVIEAAAARCLALGATDVLHTDDPDEGAALLRARRLALRALERLGSTLLDDVGVPLPALPALLCQIEAAAQAYGVTVGTFGHAGDGNLHPTIVFDGASPASVAAAQRTFDAIVRAALSLGGTITGEHGVGGLKLPWMDQQVSEGERALMRRVKAAFDPMGIMNPGRGY